MSETEEALRQARLWLGEHAPSWQLCLADALLGSAEPGLGEKALAERQDERGAVDWGEDSWAGTARALFWLRDLGREDGPVAERAAAFLAAGQHPDGSFGAGELETARSLAALACTARVRASVLARAAQWLAARWSPDGLAEGGAAAIAAWFPALSCAPDELAEAADGALQWCGRELERGFRSGRLSPLEAAGVYAACGTPALPGARLTAAEVRSAALRTQHPDGSFPGADLATLEALRALHFLGAAAGEHAC